MRRRHTFGPRWTTAAMTVPTPTYASMMAIGSRSRGLRCPVSPPRVRSSRSRCGVSRWNSAVPVRSRRVRRGCLIRQAVWLVGSSNEFRRGAPHQTGCLARWRGCQRVSAWFASSGRLSGSLARVPTSFGKVRLIRQAVWLVGVSTNEFRQLPHQTGCLGCGRARRTKWSGAWRCVVDAGRVRDLAGRGGRGR